MELHIKTLTPLWTGGAYAGKVDRIHETGILGSLRWWYEALLRGLGGKVCDPSEDACQFDVEKYEESHCLSDAGLCDVCQVFGATGWQRRFRLVITDQTQQDTSSPTRISAQCINPKTRKEPTWYFPDHPRAGSLSIRIQSRDSKFSPAVIGGLIQFIADWAAIGAKTQMGFGVIKLQNGRFETKSLYNWLDSITAGCCAYHDLPSLQNLFFACVQQKDATVQEVFNLKYVLRQLFAKDKNLRHFIMGVTEKKQRIASKVKVSRPYSDGLIRVWGWIPETAREYGGDWNREKVVNKIYNYVTEKYSLLVWREVNSPRDTIEPGNSDVKRFLKSLLGLQEEM